MSDHTKSNLPFDNDACRLHLALQRLGGSADWMPPPEQGHVWLSDAHLSAAKLGL